MKRIAVKRHTRRLGDKKVEVKKHSRTLERDRIIDGVLVSAKIWTDIISQKTPATMTKTLNKNESKIANQYGEEFLDCDIASSILSKAFEYNKISHQILLGTSKEGSSHVWIRANGKDYDPTYQGIGRKKPEIIKEIQIRK
jgi:hypothetical protein